ncbi:phosphatase PAP2 family protein [Actinospica robiniae]|uniref:phosphatase PAP2 family protein n=1 Tax=Actinospica robiniae TaxID=304901 RepID=UPI00042821F0|nr:phosphatase PAP2 family protein [Actinospica robiniae]
MDPVKASRTSGSLSPRLALVLLVALPMALLVGLLVLAVEASWAPLRNVDRYVANTLHTQALGHPALVHAMVLVSDIGSPTVMRIAATLLAVVLFLRGARRLALWTAATMISGAAIDEVLKVAVDRARPVFVQPVASAPGPSFPSGHAFTATLGAGVFLLVLLPLLPRRTRLAAWLPAALIPLAVGYSRIALGVHWTSDVLGGWLLGVGLLTGTTAAFETWRREHALPRVHPVLEGVAPEESGRAAHPVRSGPEDA